MTTAEAQQAREIDAALLALARIDVRHNTELEECIAHLEVILKELRSRKENDD